MRRWKHLEKLEASLEEDGAVETGTGTQWAVPMGTLCDEDDVIDTQLNCNELLNE